MEYFSDIKKHVSLIIYRFPLFAPRTLIAGIVFSPIISSIYYVFIKALKMADKSKKYLYYMVIINFLTFIPVFMFAVDYGRWISSYFAVQLLLIIALIYMKDENIINAIVDYKNKIVKNRYLIFIALLFMYASMDRLLHNEVFAFGSRIIEIFSVIKSIFT